MRDDSAQPPDWSAVSGAFGCAEKTYLETLSFQMSRRFRVEDQQGHQVHESVDKFGAGGN
jgi:hypothetical protein